MRRLFFALMLPLFLLATFFIHSLPVYAQTTTLSPIADAFVNKSSSSSSYGTRTTIEVDSSPVEVAYLRFDLTDLNASTIQTAKLRLKVTNGSSSTQRVKAVRNTTWSETGTTYNNRPSLGSTIANITGTTAGAWKEVDITSSVKANAGQLYSLGIDSAGSNKLVFYSRENIGDKPELVIETATPTAYYVSTTGSDTDPGTETAPFRTIQKAADTVTAGSTVYIAGGTYAEDVTLSASGSASGVITFTGYGTVTVLVRSFTVGASYNTLSGLTISGSSAGCIVINPGLTNITIKDNLIKNCGSQGIGFVRTTETYTSNVIIRNNSINNVGIWNSDANNITVYGNLVTVEENDLTGTRNDAINIWGDSITIRKNNIHDISNTLGHHNDAFQSWTGLNDGAEGTPVTNLIVEQNIIENITGFNSHCFFVEGPGHDDWTIRNNIFHNVGGQCLQFGKPGQTSTYGVQNVAIYNNTFVAAGGVNTIEFNLNTTGRLVNNVFYNSIGWGGGVPYYIASTASVTRDYNLAGGTTTRLSEAHAVNGDPLFVNPASDFHLTSGSPAINAGDDGTIISPVRSVDFDGKATLGIVDIGAYEYQISIRL